MNRFTTIAAAAMLTFAAAPALAGGEGTFEPRTVASPATAQPGQVFSPVRFEPTRGPGSHWTGPVASPAQGAPSRPMIVGDYNTGIYG